LTENKTTLRSKMVFGSGGLFDKLSNRTVKAS